MNKSIKSQKTDKSTKSYEAYGVFFETLANQNRLKIINSLRHGDKNVTQILEDTGLEQTCTSHCLKRLENCGFVSVKRNGKYRIYTLNHNTIEPLMELIDAHTSKYCIHLIDCNCAHTPQNSVKHNTSKHSASTTKKTTLRGKK